jgi:predicted acylesterase/phospholipase RssA
MGAGEDSGQHVEKAILAIDGGGIRGAIPAVVLRALEERAKRPLHELFDVIAGTSTGGILALGLAWPGDAAHPPYTASALLDLYRNDGPAIFPHELLGKVRQLFGPKYPARGRREVLRRHFGEARLSHALTEVIVTSYDIESRRPVFFRAADARGTSSYDFAMSDVAMATSAAPTYFPPVRLPDPRQPGTQMALVDGGVFANDPGMCGFVDRTTVQGRAGATLMVSLGTGRITKPLPFSRARRWGLLGWGGHILDVVFDGVTESVDYELSQVLGKDYHRLQVTLSKDEAPMDKADTRNVDRLIALAEDLVAQQGEQLDEIVSRLLARRSGAAAPGSPSP